MPSGDGPGEGRGILWCIGDGLIWKAMSLRGALGRRMDEPAEERGGDNDWRSSEGREKEGDMLGELYEVGGAEPEE